MVGDIFQPTHLLFVLVVALLVLGPKRLPEVGRTLGSGIRDFRQALSGESPDPPQRPDADQVTTTTPELRHEPETAAHYESAWPEEAIGPTSFDEPVEAATAEPAAAVVTDDPSATAVFTDAEPVDGPAHEHAGTEDASDTTLAGEVHAGSETAPPEPASEKLSFYEHALARRVSETGDNDSPESQADQSS